MKNLDWVRVKRLRLPVIEVEQDECHPVSSTYEKYVIDDQVGGEVERLLNQRRDHNHARHTTRANKNGLHSGLDI